MVGTDNVTFTDTSATYDTKNVGTGKTITVSGIALGGAQADDYSLTNTSALTTERLRRWPSLSLPPRPTRSMTARPPTWCRLAQGV